ncbi:hypothetical protein VTJ04DRAFT_726 [Mycothermus thermophilus]|uniref:uncharacterized protein n=1 Tax=Humicola insolens TaxID=85995 RepID=UPI0037443798
MRAGMTHEFCNSCALMKTGASIQPISIYLHASLPSLLYIDIMAPYTIVQISLSTPLKALHPTPPQPKMNPTTQQPNSLL